MLFLNKITTIQFFTKGEFQECWFVTVQQKTCI